MTLRDAIEVLVLGDGRKFPVIDRQGLRTLFHADQEPAFAAGLRRLVEVGLLERAAKGLYLNMALPNMGRRGTGTLIAHLRPGHLSYLSYESALAEVGSMSQCALQFLVATTGNGGKYRTRYGDLWLTQTSRSRAEILERTVYDNRINLLVASPSMAREDLERVRPDNLHLIDEETHGEIVAEWQSAGHA